MDAGSGQSAAEADVVELGRIERDAPCMMMRADEIAAGLFLSSGVSGNAEIAHGLWLFEI